MKTKSVVGDLINFRGLVYSPVNENGVVFLFGKVAEDLNMYIEEIKPGFPDCIGRRFNGKGWERVDIEFEYASSNFKTHGHDPKGCDIVICWDHDWPQCPIEVIALKNVIPGLPNTAVTRPSDSPAKQAEQSLEAMLNKHSPGIADLTRKLIASIQDISPDTWFKHNGKNLVTVYSPQRVFAYVQLQKKQLGVTVFTRGEPIPGVETFDYENAGAKWGWLPIQAEKDLTQKKAALKRSLEVMKKAYAENESTNWYAPLEDEKMK
jgi:hypothetical protein